MLRREGFLDPSLLQIYHSPRSHGMPKSAGGSISNNSVGALRSVTAVTG